MEDRPDAIQSQCDPAAFSLADVAAIRHNQSLDLAPTNICSRGPCKNSF